MDTEFQCGRAEPDQPQQPGTASRGHFGATLRLRDNGTMFLSRFRTVFVGAVALLRALTLAGHRSLACDSLESNHFAANQLHLLGELRTSGKRCFALSLDAIQS